MENVFQKESTINIHRLAKSKPSSSRICVCKGAGGAFTSACTHQQILGIPIWFNANLNFNGWLPVILIANSALLKSGKQHKIAFLAEEMYFFPKKTLPQLLPKNQKLFLSWSLMETNLYSGNFCFSAKRFARPNSTGFQWLLYGCANGRIHVFVFGTIQRCLWFY